MGIEIMGFFIVGWDEDTFDTYQHTLEFCDEMNVIPFILTLVPMPGSQIYNEYLSEGKIFTELSWDHYGGESVVFKHPKMDPEDMYSENARVLHEGFSMGRILSRTFHTFKNRPSLSAGMTSFFTQSGMKKGFRDQFIQIKNP